VSASDPVSDAEAVAEAVATGQGLDALAARLTDPSLLAVVEAARRRLRPALTDEAVRLLRAVGAFHRQLRAGAARRHAAGR
jgi:hypothetical protein